MTRFISGLLVLLSHATFGQATHEWTYNHQLPRPAATTAINSLDASPVKQPAATTGFHTVRVILPSKAVCRQKVSTFFLVTIPDTLVSQQTSTPQEPAIIDNPATNASSPKTGFTAGEIMAGTGSDVLELLLKTPGRLTSYLGSTQNTGLPVTSFLP